jgi:exodeoxyribonuclease VII small subunit
MSTVETTFEEAFDKLEATVRQLEAGDLTIEAAVALYEQGVELAGICQHRLDAVELRISRLAPLTNGGGYGAAPLDAGW